MLPAPTGPAGVSTSRDVGPATPSPRFSRVALVGAFWLAFAAVLLPIWFLRPPHPIPVGEVHQQTTPLILREALGFLLLALGFSIPLVTTICGAVAVSQIRHSAGRLCGLGLAVFDLLLFPLLVLDAALIAGTFALLS